MRALAASGSESEQSPVPNQQGISETSKPDSDQPLVTDRSSIAEAPSGEYLATGQTSPTPVASSWTWVADRLPLIRRTAVALWLIGVVAWTYHSGLAIDYTHLFIMICAGLVAASIGRQRVISVIRDWLPFLVVLFVYDLSRGAAALLGRPTQWYLQINFDRWLFHGTEPTLWLQAKLKAPFAPAWEVLVSIVYVSYFIAPYVLAGVLWLRDRAEWRKFVLRFVAVAFIGLAGFIVFPAAPPWAASQCTASEVVGGPSDPGCLYVKPGSAANGGLLGTRTDYRKGSAPWVERISNRGWLRLGLPEANSLINEGQAGVNQVAAVPSLHAATTLLIAVFLWPRVRRRWRPLVVAYPLAMGFVLVYGAEHYVFDILLGWLVTGAVAVGFNVWESRRAKRRAARLAGDAEIIEARPDILQGPLLQRP